MTEYDPERQETEIEELTRECPMCGGAGSILGAPCVVCFGKGKMRATGKRTSPGSPFNTHQRPSE
jgi:DnaJ-class molecular chaperone